MLSNKKIFFSLSIFTIFTSSWAFSQELTSDHKKISESKQPESPFQMGVFNSVVEQEKRKNGEEKERRKRQEETELLLRSINKRLFHTKLIIAQLEDGKFRVDCTLVEKKSARLNKNIQETKAYLLNVGALCQNSQSAGPKSQALCKKQTKELQINLMKIVKKRHELLNFCGGN